MTRSTKPRRSAAEWAKLVKAWKRSGQSAAAFASPLGILPTTLSWWSWRLGSKASQHDPPKRKPAKRKPAKRKPAKRKPAKRKPAKRKPARRRPAPRLIPVELITQTPSTDGGWELVSPAGHVLRVQGRLGDADLEMVLLRMGLVG